jgi:hypothetical protein
MDEHDDDLESEVQEVAQTEMDRYPDTDDQLDEGLEDTSEDEDPLFDDEGADL